MKFIFSILLIGSLNTANAQEAEKTTESEFQQDRLRIVSERQRLKKVLVEQEANCYQRFAVNECLVNVRAENHAKDADLHRQEILLNDTSRRSKGAEQKAKVDKKKAEKKTALSGLPLSPASAGTDQKSVTRQMQEQQRAEARRQVQIGRKQSHQQEAQDRADLAEDVPQNKALYQEKIEKANKHKMQIKERNQQQIKARSPSLPLPPASFSAP